MLRLPKYLAVIAGLLALGTQTVSATARTVKKTGGDFTTIQACANAAVAGDTCTIFVGTYAESVTAPNSGNAASPITFTKNAGDAVTLTGTFTISNRSYIRIVGGLAFSAASNAIVGNNATQHCTVDGNTFSGTRAFVIPDNAGASGSDNVFSNNVITRTSASTTAPAIYAYGDRNRFENNEISGGTSDAFEIGGQNVVLRGNYFHDVDGTASGEHIDFVQVIGGGTNPTLSFALIENNVEKNCDNQCHFLIVRNGNGLVSDTVITRYNYIYNMGSDGSGASYGGVGDNSPHGWFYNNTVASLGTVAENGDCVSYQNAANGVVLNNICYHTQADSWSATIGAAVANANLGFNSGFTGAWNAPYSAEPTYAALHNQNPNFANFPSNGTLSGTSPAINAGVALTTASGSGSNSTSLTVADAHGLQPGWSGAQGDTLRIGATTTAQISAVNYTTNVITLTAAKTWASADPIFLYKDSSGRQVLNGSAPDIGAFESGVATPPPPPPTSSACDVNKDNATNVADVQASVNQALSTAACAADINQDGKCNVVDVQRVVNAALGGSCVVGP